MPVHAIKMTLQNDLARRLPRQAGATCRTSSCPGLSRPSTSHRAARRTWMRGPSPRRSGFGRAGGTSPVH